MSAGVSLNLAYPTTLEGELSLLAHPHDFFDFFGTARPLGVRRGRSGKLGDADGRPGCESSCCRRETTAGAPEASKSM